MVKAIDIARRAGRKVAFTLSDTFCIDRHRDGFNQLLDEGKIDILFANEAEIRMLAGTDDFEAAVAATQGKVRTLVVTRSEDGAIAAAEVISHYGARPEADLKALVAARLG
jgi:sugar/nucleoside kinase (ribokinase family)